MKSERSETDQITVIVFKDHFASRTFHIPLSWLFRLGVVFNGIVILAILGPIYIVKNHFFSEKTVFFQSAISDASPSGAHLPLSSTVSTPLSQTSSVNVTPSVKPNLLFLAFPSRSTESSENTQTHVNLLIQSPKLSWDKNTLNVTFALQSKANRSKELSDEPQQGTIVVLARGPGLFLAYPTGVINATGSESLITPSEGESFSISRYREVDANLGPIQAKNRIQEVEIMIFNKNEKLTLYQKIPIEKPPQD